MAAEGVTVPKRCYIGLAVFTVALIASTGLYVDDSWKYKFHVTSFLSVQRKETVQPRPRKANQSRASRFVSVCSSDLDTRRLGNQLFNWAAILYVARLTGLHVCSTMHLSLVIINMLDKRQKPIDTCLRCHCNSRKKFSHDCKSDFRMIVTCPAPLGTG